jgi:hypothetical protein
MLCCFYRFRHTDLIRGPQRCIGIAGLWQNQALSTLLVFARAANPACLASRGARRYNDLRCNGGRACQSKQSSPLQNVLDRSYQAAHFLQAAVF